MNQGRKILQKMMKKKAAAVLMAAGFFVSMPMGMPTAQAFGLGWGNVLGTVIGAAVTSDSLRSQFLDAGDNPTVQNARHDLSMRQATAERPVDARAVAMTDAIMKQMIERGDYVLRNNSLPFRIQCQL